MISKSIFVVLAIMGLALPTAGATILQPAAYAQITPEDLRPIEEEEEEDFSLEEILDFAFDLADIDLDVIEDGGGGGGGDGGGDGTQDEANVSQQDSTQDRTQQDTNRDVDTQGSQRQVVVDDDGGSGTGGGSPGRP